MTVNKTPAGRWRARVKSAGRVVADRTFDRKSDATQWAAVQKRALDLGEFVDPRAGRESLAAALGRFFDARTGTVAESTLKADLALSKNLPRVMSNRPIGAIQSSDIDALLRGLLQRGLARSSVVRFRAVMSTFFSWAVEQRLVSRNPVLQTSVASGTGLKPRHEVFPFTVKELREVVADLCSRDSDQGELALVLGLTGLRWGELVALRVRDVTVVPHPAFSVSRSAPDGHGVRAITKSGKSRTVPLTSELVPLVQRRLEGKRPDDLLFVTPTGARLNGSNWRRAVGWTRSNRGRRIHDLRHSAATLWLTNGIDPKTVQTWLGHASMTLTADLYGHWMGRDSDRIAIDKINGILGDARGTGDPKLGASSAG